MSSWQGRRLESLAQKNLKPHYLSCPPVYPSSSVSTQCKSQPFPLSRYFQAGGSPENVIQLLSENYTAVAQTVNLLAEWLIQTGAWEGSPCPGHLSLLFLFPFTSVPACVCLCLCVYVHGHVHGCVGAQTYVYTWLCICMHVGVRG